MTPLIGLVLAVFVARLAPNVRAVVVSVLVLMALATAVQTYDLDADWGSNPPSTVHQVSYWIVQLIIISITLGLALGIFRVRARRAARRGESLIRPAFSGRRGTVALIETAVGTTVVYFAGAFAADKLQHHHGGGTESVPWTGVLGIVIGAVVLVALAVVILRSNIADRRSRVDA
jgi:NhaP-type Na+/H+ or K+/H+ antiporter